MKRFWWSDDVILLIDIENVESYVKISPYYNRAVYQQTRLFKHF